MSQPVHTVVEMGGIKLQVIGTYYPGEKASCDCPGEESSIEIESVLTPKGDDIGELIAGSDAQEYMEALAIEAHLDGLACAAEEAAVARREQQKDMFNDD